MFKTLSTDSVKREIHLKLFNRLYVKDIYIYLFFSAKVEKFTESEREQTFLMYIQTLNKPTFLA